MTTTKQELSPLALCIGMSKVNAVLTGHSVAKHSLRFTGSELASDIWETVC